MDFLTVEQIWSVVMFFAGSFILNTCSKWEREDQAILKDPRNHYGRRKSDIVKPKSIRGTLMTLMGAGLCLSGMILFLLHV
ncbi:MAG: hypothetical protein HOH38_10570 [Nitrospinaceae bacterium]|jgi:hypothetical protein|nr:hypothetical protein [Nitrospinaceae bacterium]